MNLRLLFPLLLLLILPGCIKNEMTLTFDLSPDVNTTCRIVYYASAKKGGMLKETVAQISAGKGEVKLPQGYPSVMYLFSSSGKNFSALIYARRGDKIIITGKGNDISSWEISGNEVTEALSKWRIENKALIVGGNVDKLNAAVARYVKEHPDSEAAAIVLYTYFQRRGHEMEFTKLEASLGKKILNDKKLMSALSSADLLTGPPLTPKIPPRIILMEPEGYADTVTLGKGSSTMLLFVNDKTGSDDLPVDSLKKLVEGRNGKTIAELYLDTDSINWSRHIAKDSVASLKRLWMPRGLADSIALTMGVNRVPYYIVIDSKGKEQYRGDSFKDASMKFKSLSP